MDLARRSQWPPAEGSPSQLGNPLSGGSPGGLLPLAFESLPLGTVSKLLETPHDEQKNGERWTEVRIRRTLSEEKPYCGPTARATVRSTGGAQAPRRGRTVKAGRSRADLRLIIRWRSRGRPGSKVKTCTRGRRQGRTVKSCG